MDEFQTQTPQTSGDLGEKRFDLPPKSNFKLWFAIILLIVAAIIVGVYYKGMNKQFFTQKEKPKTQVPIVSNKLPEGYKTVVLEKDKYPEGFPMDVIYKEGSPVWQRSEDTVDGAGMRHRVVELLYKKTSIEVISGYTEILSKLGWIIEQENISQATQVRVFLKKGASISDDQRMVVVGTTKGEGTLTSLQYLTKN